MLFAESKKGSFTLMFEGPYEKEAGDEFIGYQTGDLTGHLKLFFDSDYLKGKYNKTGDWIFMIYIESIQEKGYDLLDAIRDKGIWAEVKKELGVAGESWSMEVLAKLATKILAKKVGL